MKKFLISLSAGLFAISLFLAPVATFAADPIDPTTTCTVRSDLSGTEIESLTGKSAVTAITAGTKLPKTGLVDPVNDNFAILCVYSFIEWGTNIAFLLISALSVLVIAFAAFLYITAAGNPENTAKAKSFILYAVVGIVVAVLARVIPNVVINFLG